MQIVVNEQLKDAIEWTCKYANEYKVDIDIHIDADGEVSVSVCPTYRDTADTPQTDCIEKAKADIAERSSWSKTYEAMCKITNYDYHKYCKEREPQTDCDKCIWSVCNYNKVDWDADTPQNERSE